MTVKPVDCSLTGSETIAAVPSWVDSRWSSSSSSSSNSSSKVSKVDKTPGTWERSEWARATVVTAPSSRVCPTISLLQLHLSVSDWRRRPLLWLAPAADIINSCYVINLDSAHAHSLAHWLRDVINSAISRLHSDSTYTYIQTDAQTDIHDSRISLRTCEHWSTENVFDKINFTATCSVVAGIALKTENNASSTAFQGGQTHPTFGHSPLFPFLSLPFPSAHNSYSSLSSPPRNIGR